MSDQIDPAFKAAYRETQGQPVDAVGREPEDDDGFVTASDYVDAFLGVGSESWKQTATEYAQEVHNLRTALADKDARIAALEAAVAVQRESKEYAQRCCVTAESALTASRAECEGLRAALEFYADISKYPAPFTGGMGALWIDCGRNARAALGQKETGDAA
jgi:hypothetical protein